MSCIDVTGFIFQNVQTKIRQHNINLLVDRCYSCRNNVSSICNERRCFRNNNICVFRLSKNNLISSSLEIATNFNDIWEIFKLNIYKLLSK